MQLDKNEKTRGKRFENVEAPNGMRTHLNLKLLNRESLNANSDEPLGTDTRVSSRFRSSLAIECFLGNSMQEIQAVLRFIIRSVEMFLGLICR